MAPGRASRTQPGGSGYWQAIPVPGERTPGLSIWSKSQKLAMVLHFRDPRQKSQLQTTSCKCKATNTDLISGLDHGHYTGLQSPRPWIPVGNTAVSQWKGEVILPTPFQACLCPDDACQVAYHIVRMTIHPGSVPTPKDSQFKQRPLLGHHCRIHTLDGLRSEWQATILQIISLPYIDHRLPADTAYILLWIWNKEQQKPTARCPTG